MNKKSLLFASSEVYPFVKTGGLADVSHSLPRALRESYDVTVVLPLYRLIDRKRFNIARLESFEITMGENVYPVELHGTTLDGMEYRFVYAPLLCDREFLYGSAECGYEDNAERFALYSYVLREMVRREPYALLHLNDWQCALAALFIKEDTAIKAKTLYTIHNLAYQGVFESSILPRIGIDERYFTMEALEFYNQVNYMKAGIAYADVITTVSPTYAKEILTPEFGCGLEGFLQFHKRKLHGILNGIDTDHFSPATDAALIECYTSAKGKKASKSDLLKQLGLKGVTKPLFVFIGRLAHQKGIDLLIETLPKMAELECTIAVLGEGGGAYGDALNAIAERYANVSVTSGYDEALSHRMYAAADFLVMPSLFEPCGLNQMIAFAYGAIPIVNRVGGLADTVKKLESFEEESASGFGILLTSATSRALLSAVKKGCELYGDKKRFEMIVNHNMRCDYSWSKSAQEYLKLYQRVLK
ncbi:glycogen/starch synthase [Sulfuricurvum sp.]|uniref:glycogen synthase n=1 Tax=Sulfuricurvum sp. TaxID=2025608 RepID=UPI002E30706A|nr:glycogen/starch synthase [Sulfuricurvum sp.]HEX5329444.1 glycogen/starch synthase [Sulfuricurvum sp.]